MDWKFHICDEFDCTQEYAKTLGVVCGGDFTKEPCIFRGEHREMNEKESAQHEPEMEE